MQSNNDSGPLPLPDSVPALEFLREELNRILQKSDQTFALAWENHRYLTGCLDRAAEGLKNHPWDSLLPPELPSRVDIFPSEELYWYLPRPVIEPALLFDRFNQLTREAATLVPATLDDAPRARRLLDIGAEQIELCRTLIAPFRVLRIAVLQKLGGQESLSSISTEPEGCADPIAIDHVALLIGVKVKSLQNLLAEKKFPARLKCANSTVAFWSYSEIRPLLLVRYSKRAEYLDPDYDAMMKYVRDLRRDAMALDIADQRNKARADNNQDLHIPQ